MRALSKSIIGIALAAALAGCSHGAGTVAVPTASGHGTSAGMQSQATHGSYFGSAFATAAVCGAVRPGEARCHSLIRTDIKSRLGLSPQAISGYHPDDLQKSYKLPSSTAGTGQTIAIVDAFDDPNAESDMAVYRSTFGLPDCTTANGCFQKLNEWGQTSPLPPADTTGWSVEVSLDLDMASAICPNCKIILLEGKNNSFYSLARAVDSAVILGANTVSNSYGGDETFGYRYNRYYQHPKAIVTASSGDGAFRSGPQFPAASQFVVAVGGTHMVRDSSPRGFTESAWSGAGSGCSTVAPKPSWQTDPLCSMRMIADISAVADPFTGVAVYDTYKFANGWIVLGGTSVSSPIIAAAYNLAGDAKGREFARSIYTSHPKNLHDIVTGSNGQCGGTYECTAVPGYDGPTGMGSPHGVKAL